MSELPADPWVSGDRAVDALREGSLLVSALEGLAGEDGARRLLLAVLALSDDDARAALLVAVVERSIFNRPRPPRILRLLRFPRPGRTWRRGTLRDGS